MPGPVVSVILPTHNRASLLPRAIESVLSQDYTDLELIVIDDGSTDQTQVVVGEITDPRLRYVRLERNYGVAYARNQGILHAAGELTAFADSDDVWLPEKLPAQLQLLQLHKHIDFVFGDYLNINHVSAIQGQGFCQNAAGLSALGCRQLAPDGREVLSGLPENLLLGNFIATPTVVLRTSIFQRAGKFNALLLGASDLEFWWRAALCGVRFSYIVRPLIVRNKVEDSITANVLEFSTRKLQVLELCAKSAVDAGRSDLLSDVRWAQHRVWRSLIVEHAKRGDRRSAFGAFRCSLSYGSSTGAWANMLLSLVGVRGYQQLKEARRLMIQVRVR